MSIVLGDVDGATVTEGENLVGFFKCKTRCDFAHKIISTLQGLRLDLSYLSDQAIDGADNMAGSVDGTASLMSTEYPLAPFGLALPQPSARITEMAHELAAFRVDPRS